MRNIDSDGNQDKIELLMKIWSKLCDDDGRIQIYIKFLYKEVIFNH